jgi:hypothetical protein
MSNFKYNIELEDPLFALAPPEGYTVTTEGSAPERRSVPWPAKKLLVAVGKGIGPVEFGMSREQVVERFGEPEEKSGSKRQTLRNGVDWETESWHYNSQGFLITFANPPGGLSSVLCRPASFTRRAFQGRTEEGIGLGSSPEDVRNAYGNPSDEQPIRDGLGTYNYPDKRLMVGFVNGTVHLLQIGHIPKEKPAASVQADK